MNELSLHILDICQNSIKANSTLIEIIVNENIENNLFEIIIKDNGCGMNEKTLSEVADPFFTTRLTRKVGLGVSLFKMAAEMTEGSFDIQSTIGEGTKIKATFKHDHIDRAPLGIIEETIMILVLNEANIDIFYEHSFKTQKYVFDTREIRKILDGIPFTNYDVITWIKNNIKEGIFDIHKEETQ
jgi:hypothetical protein